ncbi:hypothetical protein LCGC14_0989530, partial [marine sediment metagenome]
LRVFSANFDRNTFKFENPEQYIGSKAGIIYDDSSSLDGYDFTEIKLQDTTYIEGPLRMHKNNIAVGSSDYISYDLPNPDVDGPDPDYEDVQFTLYVTEADPIPLTVSETLESLTKIHSASELEPLPVNILEDGYPYSVLFDVLDVSGNNKFHTELAINPVYDGGTITLAGDIMKGIVQDLPPGVNTINIQVIESDYYKSSPVLSIPLEIRPPFFTRFGQKNTEIDLIDPFVSAWGSSFSGETLMNFESNYPHLIGTLWVSPDFNGPVGQEERSIQDYIEINLEATIFNSDGTINDPFPLREGIMLRPANHEGIMTFSIGLGPEDAFLMGQECVLSLSFDASYNEYDLKEQGRSAEIILLDLQFTENPSSNTPNELWSIYNNQFNDASGISVDEDISSVSTDTGVLVLGDDVDKYGIEVEYTYDSATSTYSLDSESELLKLKDLTDITGVALYGTKDEVDYTFDKVGTGGNNDWDNSAGLSSITFLGIDTPDDATVFTVVYKLDFDINGNYGKITLNPTTGTTQSIIDFYFPDGVLEQSENSKSPMFVEYKDVFTISGLTYSLSYSVTNPTLTDFIIYNYEELDGFDTTLDDQSVSLLLNGGYLDITFDQVPTGPDPFTVSYGVKSQYNLGYGFQKQDETYSDSVRLMYNDLTRDTNPILHVSGAKESIVLEDPSLFINLDNSNSETVLELYALPLLYAPEVNFTFIIDEISLNQIEDATEFNTLKIDFYFMMDGGYSYIYETEELLLDYTNEILPYLEADDDSYIIHYNKDLQGLYEASSGDSFNIYISISQEGVGPDYLPYIILEQFDYLCDEHFAEMYDRMPRDLQGELDVRSVIHTPHYFQLFSKPFKQGVYQMYTPFNLLENSEVTIGEDLPQSNLVALNIDAQQNYAFDYLGSSETIPVTSDEFYMIKNLALFTDAYDLDEILIQEGFVDLYYGSGTDVVGEEDNSKQFYMDHVVGPINPPDYWSEISGGTASTWVSTFTFSNSFLTTNEIDVSGTAFYHQLFKLYSADIISQTDINTLFVDSGIQNIQFGVELSPDISISSIKSVGMPYTYELSVQGFPVGNYIETDVYYHVSTGSGSITYNPSQNNLEYETHYTFEYLSDGRKFLLFYVNEAYVEDYADANYAFMVDFWAFQTFTEGLDYAITEVPEDPFASSITWYYAYSDNPAQFTLHPDFTLGSSFTIDYSALRWDIEAGGHNDYIKNAVNTINFQPRVRTNISVYYDGQPSELFKILDTVPDNQFSEPDLFNYIYLYTWDGSDEDTKVLTELAYQASYITQDSQTDFLYTINFDVIAANIGTDEIYLDSYMYIETEYDSTQLKYSLSNTPFNYDYIGTNPAYNQYHITIDINNGQTVWSSNDEINFALYVEKIEDNQIYFKDGAINVGSTIDVSYKYKLQPGLLERKHFMMIVYPWTNIFEPILDDITVGIDSDSSSGHREKYRKVSGGSIITPFEYSLSVDDRYSLYISYRLNNREYYEEKFTIDAQRYIDYNFSFSYLTSEFNNYIEELVINNEAAVTVYYYDLGGIFKLLNDDYYSVSYTADTVTLLPQHSNGIDKNEITAHNGLDEFYITIVPKANDAEYTSYRFEYDPREDNILDTVNVVNWDVIGQTGLGVYPNLDAYYFMDTQSSTFDNFINYATQIASYLGENDRLKFDIEGEFDNNGDFDLLLDNIITDQFITLFIKTNIQNYDSLESLKVNLLNAANVSISTDTITIEDLVMDEFEIKVDISSGMASLRYIELEPIFRQDDIYHSDNSIGDVKFEFLEWNEELTFFDENGDKFMKTPLERTLKDDVTPIAYLFNDELQYLELPVGLDFSYEVKQNEYTTLDELILNIPNTYLDPDNPTEEVEFRDGDTIVLRYNTPIKKGIGIGIGKMYFQDKPFGYTSSMPTAELLLTDISDYEDYTTYTNPYYYKIPLELTPFNTEFSNSFRDIRIDFKLSDGQIDPQYIVNNMVKFTDMIFSVPYPNYELTVGEVIIQSVSSEPIDLGDYIDERIWQFTELEEFISDDNPIDDTYTLQRANNPLFWGDDKWLDYIMIIDEDKNYYGAAIQSSEVNHQLHYSSGSDHFVWNNNFDQFQEYYGTQIQLPLMIDESSELFFAYSTPTSWQTPILLEIENIDASTLDNVFDYNYLLTPRFEFLGDTVYDNELLGNEYDYNLTQYYSESFTVYSAASALDYTHPFDLDDYSLVDDFTNLQVFKVIALRPTLEEFEIIDDDINYDIISDFANKEIRIKDLIPGDGNLNDFDLITVILSYSYGPVSTFSEIQLTQTFHDDYISDAEATFYDYLSISFSYSGLSGELLFQEDSQTITSSGTSFEYITFNRNPAISTGNKLNDEYSEMFIDFEMFYDPYNVIYEADIDMDGKKDYKQEIDVDKDGRFDITKYGIEDPEDSENIIWYTIIQDYVSKEVIVDKTMEEEKRTEWFDIDDTAFADYKLNIFLLLVSILILPLLLYTLSTMVLPDVDYWAQKSVQQETIETQYVKSHYYSIRRDDNLDGYTDTQIDYERSNTVVQYESKDYEKTIIAAKPQNVFSFIGDWISMNARGLLGAPTDDIVFNKFLTEDKLDNGDFSDTYIQNSPITASTLEATYRKFTKDTSVTFTSEYVQEKITVTDWVDGKIEQTRIYQDVFDESEIDSDVIKSLIGAIYTIKNIGENVQLQQIQEQQLPPGVQVKSVYSTKKLSITDP